MAFQKICRVLGMITGEVIRPFQDRPLEGQLFIFVEYSPLATTVEDSGYYYNIFGYF